MFHVCSWNVRGLNGPSKHSVIRAVVSKLCNSVMCLQESKVRHVSGSFLQSFAGSFIDKCVWVESIGASGGLISCWSSRVFTCHEVIVRIFSITILVTHVASPTWEGKEEFFSELAQLKEGYAGKWIVCGGFNSTRGQDERQGRTWSLKATRLFNDFINRMALIDLPMINQSFTWSNMQKNPTLASIHGVGLVFSSDQG